MLKPRGGHKSEGSLLLLQSGGRPSTWSPPAGTRRAAAPVPGMYLMLSAGSAWAILTSGLLARLHFPSSPARFPLFCFLRRSPALLVTRFEFLDINSSWLTPSRASVLGRSPCVHRAPSAPSHMGGGTESLTAGKVGAVGPLRPYLTHQTKLQDIAEVLKLIRNDSRA